MSAFLTAEWRKLLMINYTVDPLILQKYVPEKTELDSWNGTCYVSLVGFMFLNTRLKGIKIPFHSDFEEVNLRFYVRYNDNGQWKRGVVFIKEIVPKPALTFVANIIYKEKYETRKMNHQWSVEGNTNRVAYSWKKKGWHSILAVTGTEAREISPESEEEFITEHYWGYTQAGEGKTSEYKVDHPRWRVYRTLNHSVTVDFKEVYGDDFGALNQLKPTSVFLAEGSEIQVNSGRLL